MKKKILHHQNRLLLTVIFILFFISMYGDPLLGYSRQNVAQTKTEDKVFNPDLEIVRKRVVNDLMEPPVNKEKIKQLVETIQPDGSWPGINYKDTSKTGFQHSIHLANMLDLARAYKKPGSEYYKN